MDEPSPSPEQKRDTAQGGEESARPDPSDSSPSMPDNKDTETEPLNAEDAPLSPSSEVSPASPPSLAPSPVPPRKRKRGIMRRLLVLTLEIFAALAGLLVMGIVLAAWYVSRGPVDAGFLLPHIERAMNDVRGDLRLDIDQLYLEWHGLARPMGLEAKNVTLLNAGGPFMNIEAVDLDVSLKDSLLKGLRFREANIRGLSMRLQKDPDGTVRMFNEDGTGVEAQNRTSPLTLSRIVSNLPPIYVLHLEDARIAYQDIARDTIRIFTDVDMELRRVSLDRDDTDITGYVSLAMSQDQTRDILSVDFIYDGNQRELSLSGRLEKADLGRLLSQFGLGDAGWNIALPLAARIGARVGEEWAVRNFEVNGEIEGGTIVMPEIFGERSLNIGTGAIAAALNPEAAFLALSEASVMVEGIQVSLGGGMTLPTPEKNSFSGDFALMVDRVETDALDSLWPVFGQDEPAYEWLVDKASDGHFSDIAVRLHVGGVVKGTAMPDDATQSAQDPDALPGNLKESDPTSDVAPTASYSPLVAPPPSKPRFEGNVVAEGSEPSAEQAKSPQEPDFTIAGYDWRISGLNAGFGFNGLKIDYNPPMIPAQNIQGVGRVEGKSMTLMIDRAALGGLQATSGTLFFDDLVTAGAGHAKIVLKVTGPVRAAFEYLSTDPINFDEGLDIDIARAKGLAEVDVTVDFPAIKDLLVEDINVAVKGTLSDVTLPGVLHGLPLTGGPYQIDATQNEYRMTGQGFLDGHDIDLDWHSYFSKGQGRPYESRIRADLVANDDLRRKIGIDLSDHVEGALPVSVDYTDAWDKSSSIDVSGSLRSAILKIEPFEFVKPAGHDGRFSAKATLQDGKIDHLYDLDIMAETVTLKAGDFKFDLSDAHKGRIVEGKIARLAFGNNNFSVRLEEGRDRSMKISLEGEKLDARPFMARDDDDSDQGEQDVPNLRDKTAYEVGLKVQTMQTGDNAEIKGVQAFIRGGNGRLEQIELDAAVGKGALYMRYNPDTKERYSLRLEADDAGAALKAFGVTDKVTGGKMTVAGIPMDKGRGGDVRGLARIDDFQVSAAPALASLVKVMDVPTLLSTINTKGLSFARLETEFEWRNRRGGGLIRFIDGRTSGGSMGLTFEGDVNKTENRIDLSGTVVPASTLNSFFSGIPIVGEILSGGSGSIFAATYRMTGDADDPKTTINPLSVLTPGFLRRLLFEN